MRTEYKIIGYDGVKGQDYGDNHLRMGVHATMGSILLCKKLFHRWNFTCLPNAKKRCAIVED